LKKTQHKERAGGLAQGVGPEFKFQYTHKKVFYHVENFLSGKGPPIVTFLSLLTLTISQESHISLNPNSTFCNMVSASGFALTCLFKSLAPVSHSSFSLVCPVLMVVKN
jgi:hypothetical protein